MSQARTLDILLVAHGLPPESVGGVEQHVDGLARALVSAGHRVEVYARTGGAGPQGEVRDGDGDDAVPYRTARVVYRYEDIEDLRGLYRVPLLDRAFAAFLAKRQFDVAHVHHLTGMSTGLLGELREAGIPSVLTLHDYWLMCPRGQMWHTDGTPCARVEPERCGGCLAPAFGGWLPPAHRAARLTALHADALAVLGTADRLVAPSSRVAPAFAALGLDPDRIRVVENGVDTTALEQLEPPPVHREGPLRVGYLGTLIPSKGLDVLVDAFQQLPPGTAELSIWGNAVPYHGDEGFLQRVFGRLRPGDAVAYRGPYHTGDLPRILAPIDVVVAPALWHEAFGLTVREGLAAARPVIVSRIGGLQDAVEDGVEGLVVEPGDREQLAAALQRLAGDRAGLAAMGRAGRRRCRGFAAMAHDLLALYREIANGHAESTPAPGGSAPRRS